MITLSEWENQIDELIKSKPKKEAALLRKGADFAKMAHEGAYRKNTDTPYIVHPYEVCLVASTVTDDVDVLVAALLHDVVEDTSYTLPDILDNFGDRIASFVSDESEDKMEDIPKAMSWIIRKEKFLEHLKTAPIESRIICLGDKVSNLRATVGQYRIKGDKVWEAFNQKDPKRHAWYYRTIADVIAKDLGKSQAFSEYMDLYRELFGRKIEIYKTQDGGMKMEVIVNKQEGNTIYVGITGKITSANADEMYNNIHDIALQNENAEYVFDLDGLEMISSAGLRVFLKLKKEKVTFRIINASADVYDVFDMTGFVQMFDIKKAYRKMSVDGCTVIGEGAKGIVYKIDDETIIKVYKDPDCMDDIINERECARKALVMGVPTAIPFDIVLVGDKYGSVFELVAAKSLTKSIVASPDKMKEYVAEYAGIMKDVHSVVDDGSFGIELPKIKDEIKTWAQFAKDYVDESIYSAIEEYVDSIEDNNTLLHGDGHPNNVMCTRDGMIFIDMDTLCTGSPYADVAIVYTGLIGYKVSDPDDTFLPFDMAAALEIWNTFIREYCKGESEETIAEVEKWCKKFCYLRLFRRGIRKESSRPCFAQNAKKALIEAFS